MCHTRHMNTSSINRYKHHRFPTEVISYAVWLSSCVCLSDHDVEELLFTRGIIVTYRRFGSGAARSAKRMPINSGAGVPGSVTRGTWMRSF
jgi:hypothetical protein